MSHRFENARLRQFARTIGSTKLGAGKLSDVGMLAVLSIAAFAIYSIAWPLHPGRDFLNYVFYYLQYFERHPGYQMLALYRTPVAPFVIGVSLDFFGVTFLRFVFAALYVVSVAAVYVAAAGFGRRFGLACALLTLCYPPFGALMHEAASDSVFAAVLIVWIAFTLNTAGEFSRKLYFVQGILVFFLTLTRPSSQVFVALVLYPFLIAGGNLRGKASCAGVFALTAGGLLLSYCGYNYLRYDDFTISRGSGGIMPFYRLFVYDKFIDSGNGPKSKLLADAVANDLLHREPYASNNVTLEDFFHSGSVRMWGDLFALSDRTWGWQSKYAVLRCAALEAIERDPDRYRTAVQTTILDALFEQPAFERSKRARRSPAETAPAIPTKGQIIPQSSVWWLATAPPGDEAARQESRVRLDNKLARFRLGIPVSTGSADFAKICNGVTRLWPPMALFILLGAAGLVFRRRLLPAERALLFLTVICLGHLVVIYLGIPKFTEYRLPYDPLFVIFGLVGARKLWSSLPGAPALAEGDRQRSEPGPDRSAPGPVGVNGSTAEQWAALAAGLRRSEKRGDYGPLRGGSRPD